MRTRADHPAAHARAQLHLRCAARQKRRAVCAAEPQLVELPRAALAAQAAVAGVLECEAADRAAHGAQDERAAQHRTRLAA